jgi:hypothetical protein
MVIVPKVVPSSEYEGNDYYETETSFGGKSSRELATRKGKSIQVSKIIKCDNSHHCGEIDLSTWYEVVDTIDDTKNIYCESCLRFLVER